MFTERVKADIADTDQSIGPGYDRTVPFVIRIFLKA